MVHRLLTIDPDSAVAPFEQIRGQLADAITSGALGAEERLPPIRQLASDVGLASNTVARAYRELESAGLVETRGRNGTFVVGTPSEARQRATTLTREFIANLAQLGINPVETMAIVRREVDRGARLSD